MSDRTIRSRRALACVAALLMACQSAPVPTPTAAPTVAIATASATASAVPTPTGRPRSTSIQATAVASIPRAFLYVDAFPAAEGALWLVDLSGATPPAVVARYRIGNGAFSATADGKTVVILARGLKSVLALHVLDPLTGDATVLYDPADARATYQKVSPDGRYVAFARYPTSGGPDGIWLIDIASGNLRQLVSQPAVDSNAMFISGWSDDGQWVSYSALDPADLGGFGGKVFIANVTDGRRITVGRGFLADWRAGEPRLVFSAQTGRGNQGAFGAMVSTYDLSTQRTRELLNIDPGVSQVLWSPVRDEFLYIAETTGCNFASTVWIQPLVGPAKRVGNLATVEKAWWSADGTAVLALVPGKGMDAEIVDAVTGLKIATIPEAGLTRTCP